ncbi:GNAT family N-acetyltransferase [Cryobacterium sp. PH29-G1]|uniref:GNAT family N-acetyltransferase n=1 Tax=Cryobacterium sp. PH29-G1 TaxID=3046211 RepID=UPI0024BB5330|nr:GNAT family N-acetyltransferase [Cryobacterium sp. PH29-G1]MDJ0349173.1 GNAT family N-acetyltransferase [Cryobacterium sp. PH29-G1]
MSGFTIDELVIPAGPAAPGWADFEAVAALRNIVETAGFGTDELNFSAAELLPVWLNTRYDPKRMLVARAGGTIVGRATYETVLDQTDDHAWVGVQVLPQWRGRGIGSALADRIEELAATENRHELIVYTASADASGERLTAPTGFGSVPRGNPEVRFLLARGYRLEQVERGSRLALPADQNVIRRFRADAAARAGRDYTVRCWSEATPPRWRDDLAVLFTRMSADAPTAGLEEPEDVWTAERLVDEEHSRGFSPRRILTAAAVHEPSGHLVAFTQLSVPAEMDRAVGQEDTLVLREHRGNRLGMLLKTANLEYLTQESPGHPSVITFNAEENRHMLDVNEALGFVPMGHEGAWKRVVPSPAES